VVTSLRGDPQQLYEKVYCARGEAENRIKEQQLCLFADRTSSVNWFANQLRVLLLAKFYVGCLFFGLMQCCRVNATLEHLFTNRLLKNKHRGLSQGRSRPGNRRRSGAASRIDRRRERRIRARGALFQQPANQDLTFLVM
jgi:hypothetical protein